MASRLAISATRRPRLCSGVRSTNCFSWPGIGHIAQFDSREAEATKVNSCYNRRIDGALPVRNKLWKPYAKLWGKRADNYWPPAPWVSETKCSSLSPCLQPLKADISPKHKPKPKPDIFINYRDKDDCEYFAAYSLEEDGAISPKYYIYPPSFLAKAYYAIWISCNGLSHFHDGMSGHVLWNPTTSEYKILPKPPPPRPKCYPGPESSGMWSDHKFEDCKLLHIVNSYLEKKGRYRGIIYHIYLYSLKTNSWKRIPCPEFLHIKGAVRACVSGLFCCLASQNETPIILSFDFSTETFSTLPLPNVSGHFFDILEYKGLLCAFECWNEECCIPWKYELWVVSDGSWIRESVFNVRGVRKPFCFSQDGKLLYFASLSDELLVFDRATGKLKHLGADCPWGNQTMIPFFESFVQLNGVSHVEEKHEQEKEVKEEKDQELTEAEGPLILA